MNRIGHIIRKEFHQLSRDRRLLVIVFMAPILQLVLLGYAANLDVRDIPTVVLDHDLSKESRTLLTRFTGSGYFVLRDYASRQVDIDRALDSGEASIAIVIPRGFGKSVRSGHEAGLQIVVDGADSNSAVIGLGYANMILRSYSIRPGSSTGTRIVPEIRVWYNPEMKSRNFFVPGILALLLMVMTMLLTSLAIVKEKEVGTLEQLNVSPIRPVELMLGKLFPFTLIGLVDVILVLLVASIVFRVPIRGSIPLLFGLTALFLLTTLGLGLLISTLSKTQQQAMVTAFFFFMVPMIFLSGFIFPIENMPLPIQYLTYLLPLRYYFSIVRGLFLKGVGLAELWDEALILLGFGVVIFLASALRFRKRLD
jgi:ABC-2 type transport system permease protein